MTSPIVLRDASPSTGGETLASRSPTVDVLAELDELALMARKARRAIDAGEAVTGSSALARIEAKANDAARWARKERTTA